MLFVCHCFNCDLEWGKFWFQSLSILNFRFVHVLFSGPKFKEVDTRNYLAINSWRPLVYLSNLYIAVVISENRDAKCHYLFTTGWSRYAMKRRSASIWQMTKQAKRGKGRVAGSITILEQSMLMTMRGTRMLGFAGNQLLIQEGLEWQLKKHWDVKDLRHSADAQPSCCKTCGENVGWMEASMLSMICLLL